MMKAEDRELLELAAKAAGWEIQAWSVRYGSPVNSSGENQENFYWNPLTDDGDAMRLLVKLHLELRVVDYGAIVWSKKFNRWIAYEAHLHGGIEAATRLAIVHAAAEIGKTITTKEAA